MQGVNRGQEEDRIGNERDDSNRECRGRLEMDIVRKKDETRMKSPRNIEKT